MCIYEIGHNRAIRPCHPCHSMPPLALFLPRGKSMILITKTSDQTRQRRHTLRVQFLLERWGYLMPSSPLPFFSIDSIDSLHSLHSLDLVGRHLSTELILFLPTFFSCSAQVSPVSHIASKTILGFLLCVGLRALGYSTVQTVQYKTKIPLYYTIGTIRIHVKLRAFKNRRLSLFLYLSLLLSRSLSLDRSIDRD